MLLAAIEYKLRRIRRQFRVIFGILFRDIRRVSDLANAYRTFKQRSTLIVELCVDSETDLPTAELSDFLSNTAPAKHLLFHGMMREIALSPLVEHLQTLQHSKPDERAHYEPHAQFCSGIELDKPGPHYWFPEYSFLINQAGKVWRHATLGRYADPHYMSTYVTIPPDERGVSRFQPYWLKHSTVIAQNVLIGTHYASSNYGHFLLDIAPLLPFAVQYDIPIVCKPLTSWQRQVLSAFGVNPVRILEPRERVLELLQPITSNRHACQGTYSANPALAETFLRLLKAAGIMTPAQSQTRRLFVSRGGHRNRDADRNIANRDALEMLMRQRGFEVVRPEGLSFLEQAALFAAAREVVCEFGAGFANVVFCQPGTTVVEIIPEGMNGPWSVNLATALALIYLPVFQCVSLEDRETVTWGNRQHDNRHMQYNVDLDLLHRVLDNV